MTEVAIVDYGAGNLLGLSRAVAATGATPRIITEPAGLDGAAGVILPGVGAAGSAMRQLRASGLDTALRQRARPLLGICLGMQLLFDASEEDDTVALGLIAGDVARIAPAPGIKVPHMGWNAVTWDAPPSPLFAGLASGAAFYYVHSYTCWPADTAGTAWSDHGGPICAAIVRNDLWGAQFHPEKSGADGLRLLANFVARLG